MDESYFRDRISGYFDKSLPPDEYQLVDDYLKDSPEGRRLLEEIGRLDEFVRMHSELDVDDGFFERQAQSIEARLGFASATPANVEPVRPKGRGGATWKWIGVAASIAFLGFIGFHESDIFGPTPKGMSETDRLETPAVVKLDTMQSIDAADDEGASGLDEDQGSKDVTSSVDAEPEAARESAPVTNEAKEVEKFEIASKSIPTRPEVEPALTPTPEIKSPTSALDEESPVVVQSPGVEVVSEPPSSRRAAPAATQAQSAPITTDFSDETAVAKEQVAETVDTSALLASYRAQRDSLMKATPANGGEALGLSKKEQPQSREYYKPIATPLSFDTQQSQLLEACYQIAKLTDSDSERSTMISQIEGMAADTSSVVGRRARLYLDELTHK